MEVVEAEDAVMGEAEVAERDRRAVSRPPEMSGGAAVEGPQQTVTAALLEVGEEREGVLTTALLGMEGQHLYLQQEA